MGQTQGGGNGDFGGETNGGGSPWQKLLMGGVKGGLSGFSDMQKQNAMMRQGGGPADVPMAMQPQVNLPGSDLDGFTNKQALGRTRNPYFYGYGGGQ